MAADIDRVAAEAGVSRSALIRAAVDHYLSARPDRTPEVHEAPAAYAPAVSSPAPPLVGLHRVLRERPAIAALCQHHGVRRLWLFGSAVRDDFVPGESDYDFQVEFEVGFDLGPWATHLFDLAEGVGDILGARVDMGEARAAANPYLKAAIEAERVLVYESV